MSKRPMLINAGSYDISGPDDIIPRAAAGGHPPPQADPAMPERYFRAWDGTMYGRRVRDAAAMLKRGVAAAEIREQHGGVVLRQARAITHNEP